MKRAIASLCIALAAAVPAAGQIAPFDMSPERSEQSVQPVPQPTVPPAAPDASPAAPTPRAPVPAAEPSPAGPSTPAPTATGPSRRYLVPFPQLILAGEYARRSWSIYLTQEQATAKATLNLAYQNAVVVAPEISHLRVTINGAQVLEAPIASPNAPSRLSTEIPVSLLNAGMNDISIEAIQRHRTDCTIESTYELWTQIVSDGTYLSFEDGGAGRWRRVDDVRAIGVNANGATRFNLVVPSAEEATATPAVIQLAQSLALMANMPEQVFAVSESAVPPPGPGAANVVVGTASELAGLLPALPAAAAAGPTVAVVDDPKLGPSTLVVSGPTWQAVGTAVDGLSKQVDRPADVPRATLATRQWRTPDVRMLFGATKVSFADLGVSTLEFSGRRIRTDFAIGVPADFYASAYGYATILLDAAYSPEVLPGSHIDIYVNDDIAATVPITTSGGEILRHLPIQVPMRHFRPGENVIAIEAILRTEADRICAPGATALDNGRFVLFDSSEFVMPDYARIGRTPELSALGGTGFPFGRAEAPVPLIFDRTQLDSLSAASTLLGRIAVAAGRLVPIDTNASAASLSDRNAIILSSISQVPPEVLAQLGISDESRSDWGETVASVRPDTQATFDEWRERLRGSGWRGRVSRLEEWLNDTFNLSSDSFRIFQADTPAFQPGGNASLMVAANYSPSGDGTWLLVTAPANTTLRNGVNDLIDQSIWRQLDGHITTLNPATNSVAHIPTTSVKFIETQPFSLRNYRLIAANWFSSNALSYGLVLIILSILLGFATAGLLGTFGRRD